MPNPDQPTLPVRVFGAVVRPVQAFLRLEAASGILLLLCSVAALIWANLSSHSYAATFEYPLQLGAGGSTLTFTLHALINNGLMTVFFFVVGMEIKRELAVGELDSLAKASLPAIAAVGGMAVPAGIYVACNWGGPGLHGWGIPVATDIAFCVGILTLLENHVPRSLIVFMLALAIFDDIGGILIIALFYGHGLSVAWLLGAAAISGILLVLNRARVVHGWAYALAGTGLWVCLHHGGIHATIAGVVVGLAIPARPLRPHRKVLRDLKQHIAELEQKPADEELDGAEILAIEERLEELEAPVTRFMAALHPLVAFLVMPSFALANAGVSLHDVGLATLAAPVALGTALGLFAGKLFGVFGPTMLAVKLGWAPMPAEASPRQLLGISAIAGIGFTVALFIAALAFYDAPDLLDQAKLGILLGSFAAGLLGVAILRFAPRSRARDHAESSSSTAADKSGAM